MNDAEDATRDVRQPESYAYRDAAGTPWSRLTRTLGRAARAVTQRRRS